MAAVAPHSKSGLTAIRRQALGDTVVTRDGIVRLRPPTGMRFRKDHVAINAEDVANLLGEVAITERALLDGTIVEGPLRAALLVENRGAYEDVEAPEGWLLVHVPGWDTATVRIFLARLPLVPIVHFGDLDPAGVRILRHLQQIEPRIRWAVPEFWREYIDKKGLPGEWSEDLSLEDAPVLIHELARRRLWLEQEPIAIDSRLGAALEAIAAI
jgi:hypothetical protein